MTSQQQYSLRWNDYTTYITGAFDALRYEEDLVDVTLFCEGRKIRAHKVLLSACSSYFKDIFKENPCQHPVIIFKNVKYADLLSLVEFMYQGEVSVSQDALPSFLHTAELLSIRGLADTNNEQHHTVIPDQPTSTLAQQILQTQTQTLAPAAAITTTEPVYFTLPSNSSIVPQIKNQPNQSATALQELVDSVVSAERTKKPKPRLVKPKEELSPSPSKQTGNGSTSSDKPTTNYNALGTATTSAQSSADNGMGMYEQTQQAHEQVASFVDSVNTENNDVKLQMTEYISVGESINPTSGDSGTFTQQEGYEMVDESISDRQDADEHMGQNSFEMEIVDMDGIFQEQSSEQQQDTKPQILEGVSRSKEDKKFKCKLCDKSFATWKSLAMHRHIHSGRTKCTICGAVLSRTANLKRHMKLKHEP
uniref:BTB domain-containing protein n=1 Tax=Anopheles atroparvus TaxID=41427 RepID=A0A182ITD6_ANOAO